MARKASRKADPVISTQGGHQTPVDPGNPVSKEAVRRRAYELFELRGKQHGHALQDWLDAERQLRAERESFAASP